LFAWLRSRRRRKIAAQPFPAAWDSILKTNAYFYWNLSHDRQLRVRQYIQILVAEKNWEGCGGLVLRDEHRVTIAAQLAKFTRGNPEETFDQVRSILIYPDAYMARSHNQIGAGVIVESASGRLGEAWYRGPVILSWADVLTTSRGTGYGRNVVVHEFAHQLDMRNGSHADGIPVIESADFARRWVQTMPLAWERLIRECQSGISTCLDCYGATNQAEFFAVASEAYFELPDDLQSQWPEVYRLLNEFYDP
jgi:Mlc titration factor MtfA (ptsG expression regulator)